MNLRNEVMVKRYIRHTTLKSDLDYNSGVLLNDLKVFHDDSDFRDIQDIEADTRKLILCNDSEFKLSCKPKLERIGTENLRNKNKSDSVNKFNNISEDNEATQEHIIRIECTYVNNLRNEVECYEYILPQVPENKHLKNYIPDTQDNNLQTLKTTMAISKPNINNSEQEVYPQLPKHDKFTIQLGNDINPEFNSAISAKKAETISGVLNIPLSVEMDANEMCIAFKVLTKWRQYVIKRKETISKQRDTTLSNFFEKLSKKKMNVKQSNDYVNKAKALARDYDTYEHR
jgi:hypothetical protein